MNGELVREQEAPVIQDVRALGAEESEPHERTWKLSSFREDESVRVDDSWLNNGLRTSKTKKDKKMVRPNNEGPLFG